MATSTDGKGTADLCAVALAEADEPSFAEATEGEAQMEADGGNDNANDGDGAPAGGGRMRGGGRPPPGHAVTV